MMGGDGSSKRLLPPAREPGLTWLQSDSTLEPMAVFAVQFDEIGHTPHPDGNEMGSE
jgi:hypothetical protein